MVKIGKGFTKKVRINKPQDVRRMLAKVINILLQNGEMTNDKAKTIEERLPEAKGAAVTRYKPNKNDLLIFDFEEYYEVIAAYVMSLYIGDQEQARQWERKGEQLLEALEPVSNPSQHGEEKILN